MENVLEIDSLCRSFGPVRVLDRVSLSLAPGRVLGLCGENGAGKSTLLRCVAGFLRPDSGTVRIDAGGDGRRPCYLVPQEFALVPDMTVVENLYLGREIVRHGILDRASMRGEATWLLSATGSSLPPDARVADLGVADRQKIEIARAFLQRSRLLLFDEPTTVLDAAETAELFATIRAFVHGGGSRPGRKEKNRSPRLLTLRSLFRGGGSVVYVSHKLPEVLEICDEVAVLRDGVLVARRPASEFTPATLAECMVGRPLSHLYPPKLPWRGDPAAPPALEAVGLADGGRVRDVSFRLREGEILGLAGLAGAGRTELAELLCGASRRTAGTLRLFGREVRFRDVHEALAAGVTYLPEDRQGAGVLPDFSVEENATLASLSAYRRGPFVDFRARRAAVRRRIDELRIKCEDPAAPVRSLSGGNQQKVVLAKGLETRPRVFVFDEPTRGVDVGARADLYAILRDLAARGMAVLLVSSDLDEIVGNCDRVLVMHEGRIAGEVSGGGVTETAIVRLAHGLPPVDAAPAFPFPDPPSPCTT